MEKNKIYDCQRGCEVTQNEKGEHICTYNRRACKLSVFDWLEGIGETQAKLFTKSIC